MTFKIFFILPISVGMYLQAFLFPLEISCFFIIGGFIVLEVIFGLLALRSIVMQKAAFVFHLRNAPLIDPNFGLTFKARGMVKSSREIALGLKKHKEETYADDKYLRHLKYY